VLISRNEKLKAKYAKTLIETWKESTDPIKHVFEDLGIAAFLIELWTDMFRASEFPGFVDIGCGNGLLVYILNEEGYHGWGFDARSRKSWSIYGTDSVSLGNTEAQSQRASSPVSPSRRLRLRQLVLVPECLPGSSQLLDITDIQQDAVQNGEFPKGTFIISNHADELTPWTPILAARSDCPFLMIPCCSHDLSGAKYRAPAPKGEIEASSTYGSFVAWVSKIAGDCGWEVEREMLRIPSTRNAAIIGRHRTALFESFDSTSLIQKYGGAVGYRHNAAKLLKTAPSGH
jgi:tRNASer (uridine44-2'-O)-methyltransferase